MLRKEKWRKTSFIKEQKNVQRIMLGYRINDLPDNVPNDQREVGVYYDERMLLHKHRELKDERPGRVKSAYNNIRKDKMAARCDWPACPAADFSELIMVHEQDHIDMIGKLAAQAQTERDAISHGYDSVLFNEKTTEAASLAAGAVVQGLLSEVYGLAQLILVNGVCTYTNLSHHNKVFHILISSGYNYNSECNLGRCANVK